MRITIVITGLLTLMLPSFAQNIDAVAGKKIVFNPRLAPFLAPSAKAISYQLTPRRSPLNPPAGALSGPLRKSNFLSVYAIIKLNYNNKTGDNGFNPAYDISCDNKLNVVEIAYQGFSWERGY